MKHLLIILTMALTPLCFGGEEPAKEKDAKVYLCVHDLKQIDAPTAHAPEVLEHLQKGETVCVYDEKSFSMMRVEDGLLRALMSVESPDDAQQQVMMLFYIRLGKTLAEDEQVIGMGVIAKLDDETPTYIWGLAGIGAHTAENPPPGYTADQFILATMKLMVKAVNDFGVQRDWKDLLERRKACEGKAKEAAARRAREAADAKNKEEQRQRDLTRTALLILKDAEAQVSSEKPPEEKNAEPERAPPPQEQQK